MADMAELGISVQAEGVGDASQKLEELTGAAARAEKAVQDLASAKASSSVALAAARAQYAQADADLAVARLGADTPQSDIEAAQALRAKAFATYASARADYEARAASLAATEAMREETQAALAAARAASQGGRGFEAMSGTTSDISAQFRDIALSLHGGESWMIVALQQGTQLAATLETVEGGAKGIASALGAAFRSMVSPISLITVGIIAAGGALYQYLTSADSGSKSATEAIKKHTENIKAIKDAYGDAAAGLQEYVEESRATLEANSRETLEATKEMVASAAADKVREAKYDYSAEDFAGNINIVNAFRKAIYDLRQSVEGGTPDLLAYRAALSEIANSPDAWPKQKALANTLRELDDETLKAARALPMMQAAVNTIGDAAFSQISGVNTLAKAMRELSSVSLPDLSDTDKAQRAYAVAYGTARTREERDDAYAALQAALTRIDDQNSKVNRAPNSIPEKRSLYELEGLNEATKTSSAANSNSSYASAVRSIQEQTAALKAQNAAQASLNPLINDYGFSLTKAKTAADLLAAAEKDKKATTPELTADIDAQAEALAQATVEQNKLAEATKNVKDNLEFMKSSATGFLATFRQGITGGENAMKAFGDAALTVFDKIASKIEDTFVNSLFDPTGILGSLFKIGGSGDPWSGLRTVSSASSVVSSAGVNAAAPRATPAPRSVTAQGQGIHITVGLKKNGLNIEPEVIDIARTEARSAAGAVQGTFNRWRDNGFHKDVENHLKSRRVTGRSS